MEKILLFITLLFTLTLFSCQKELISDSYRYEVSGTSGSYSVTIQNCHGDTQQWDDVGNGWVYSWTQCCSDWRYVSAQNNDSYGTVTVKIIKNGNVMEKNTSYGGYTIATASGNY